MRFTLPLPCNVYGCIRTSRCRNGVVVPAPPIDDLLAGRGRIKRLRRIAHQ